MIRDPSVRANVLPLLIDRLADLPLDAAALRLDDWWAGAVPGLAPTQPDMRYDVVVSVDALRTTPNPTAHVSKDGRLYFVELAEIHGSGRGPTHPPLDITGHLWSRGFSTIDVDRPRFDGPGGAWEVAIGIARHRKLQPVAEDS